MARPSDYFLAKIQEQSQAIANPNQLSFAEHKIIQVAVKLKFHGVAAALVILI